MKIILRCIFIVPLVAAAGVSRGWAQAGSRTGTPDGQGVGGPCRADVSRFCPGQRQIGPRAVQKCLAAHVPEITMACRDHLIEEAVLGPEIKGTNSSALPCQPDQVRFCPGSPLRDHLDAACACLGQHLKDLSPGCQPLVEAKRVAADQSAVKAVAANCKAEARAFCQDTSPIQSFLFMSCLIEQKDRAAKACQEALGRAIINVQDSRRHRSWWRWW